MARYARVTKRKRQTIYGRRGTRVAALPVRFNRPLSDRRMMERTTLVLPRHEIKVLDSPQAQYIINSIGNFAVINNVVQGPAFYNRIGTKIAMKTLQIKGNLLPTGQITTDPDYIRIMIVYDKQTNAAYPTTQSLLSDYNYAGITSTNSYSGINMTNRERFLVLMDEKIYGPAIASSTAGATTDPVTTTFNINRFIRLRDLSVMYNQTNAGTIGDIQTGGLYIFTIGLYGTTVAPYTFQADFRLKYDDI